MLMRRKPLIAATAVALATGGLMFGLQLIAPGVLKGDAGAGCAGVDGLVDREQAKNEGRSLVIQVLASFAMGYDRVISYRDLAEPVMESPSTVAESNGSNCYQSELEIESITERSLTVDFASCEGDKGKAKVDLIIPNPLGGAGTDPDAPADDDSEAPQGETTTATITLIESVRDGIHLDGSATLVEREGGRSVTTDLNSEFLDYAGLLQVQGEVLDAADGGHTAAMSGVYRSVSGLDWQLDVTNLGLSGDCRGARSGTMTATYEAEGDPVVVEATFSAACDGCAQVTIDGEQVPDICLPELLKF